MTTDQVTLTHPGLPGVRYACAASQAWVWERAGWQPGGDGQPEAAPDAPAAPETTNETPAAEPATSKES